MDQPDARRQRSRAAILGAFYDLVLRLPYHQISIAGLIAQAGVARSTFYEHFASKDALLSASLRAPLGPLVELVGEQPSLIRAEGALAHFAANRVLAVGLLQGATGRRVRRVVEQMLAEQLRGRGPWRLPLELVAVQLAAALLGGLSAWLASGAQTPARDLADGQAALLQAAVAALRC